MGKNIICGIYSITSPTSKVYVGLSRNIYKRWREHKNDSIRRKNVLYKSIVKHGYENHTFEILHELPSDVEDTVLNEYETIYYEAFKNCGLKMLNSMRTGINFIDYKSETRNGKISEAMKGRKVSQERRAAMSERMKTFKHSEDSKIKIGIKNSQRIWTKESKDKKGISSRGNKYRLGKKHTTESREKMSKSMTGLRKGIPHSREHVEKVKASIKKGKEEGRIKQKPISEETRKRMSESCKKRFEKHGAAWAKKVVCIENGKEYDSMAAAASDLGLSTTAVSMVCRGEFKSMKGYSFKYK